MVNKNWFASIPEHYLTTAAAIGRLTRAEELEHSKRARKGDKAATQALVEKNLLLVVKMALKYQGRGVELDDLIQEGNIGLMRAIDKFDPERGFRLSTYATPWIQSFIERSIMNTDTTIRLPLHIRKNINKCLRANKSLQRALGRDPSVIEIAAMVEQSPTVVKKTLNLALSMFSVSLDDERTNIDAEQLADDHTPLSVASSESDHLLAARLLEALPDRDREVICRRFGLRGHEATTLQSVGDDIGISRTSVQNIERDAIKVMRKQVARA